MANVKKTITLTVQQDGWIKSKIDAGDYIDDSEYIRDLIRREQDLYDEMEAVRAALIEGENSGEPQPFDFNAFKESVRTGRG